MEKVISSTAEISLEELLEYKERNAYISFVVENKNKKDDNKYRYSLDEMIAIKEKISSIISGLDEKFDEPDKQKKIFTYIYTRLAHMIDYDEFASSTVGLTGYDRDMTEDYRDKASNLIGGLFNGKSMCGGYSEILRNVLLEAGIECIYISGENKDGKSGKHAWNQVKLDGKWYNVDLTNDRDRLLDGRECKYFLKSNTDLRRYEQYDIESFELHGCTESLENYQDFINEYKYIPPQISSKDIATASKSLSISKMSNVKNFFTNILNKIAEKISGKAK